MEKIEIQKSTRRERIGWYLYDWANSAFPTTVLTVFMGPYLSSIAAAAADADKNVSLFGLPVYSESLYPYLISISVFFQLLILPFVGAIADRFGIKKQLLGLFTFIGAASTASLFFLAGTNYVFGSSMFVIANISFGAAMVVYNSFLSEIAEDSARDRVSSIGWGIGYLGGGILLLLNLIIYANAGKLFPGANSTITATRICLASAGIWWGVFSVFPMLWLKNKAQSGNFTSAANPVLSSINKLIDTIKDLKNEKNALIFLLAFICYNDGVQAVIALSAQFARRELGIPGDILIVAILVVQFVAFFGALLFDRIAKPAGSRSTILILIVIWTFVVLYSFALLHSAIEFVFLAIIIALGMGGIQALSRSMYSRIIPQDSTGAWFGIYELCDNGSSMLGPLAFAISVQFTKSYRFGILSLAIFFIVGFFLLIKVKDGRQSA